MFKNRTIYKLKHSWLTNTYQFRNILYIKNQHMRQIIELLAKSRARFCNGLFICQEYVRQIWSMSTDDSTSKQSFFSESRIASSEKCNLSKISRSCRAKPFRTRSEFEKRYDPSEKWKVFTSACGWILCNAIVIWCT